MAQQVAGQQQAKAAAVWQVLGPMPAIAARGVSGRIGAASGGGSGLAPRFLVFSQAQGAAGAKGVAGPGCGAAMQWPPRGSRRTRFCRSAEAQLWRSGAEFGRQGGQGQLKAGEARLAATSWRCADRKLLKALPAGLRNLRTARGLPAPGAFCRSAILPATRLVGPGWGERIQEESGSRLFGLSSNHCCFTPQATGPAAASWRLLPVPFCFTSCRLAPNRQAAVLRQDGPDRIPDQATRQQTSQRFASSWPAIAVRAKGQTDSRKNRLAGGRQSPNLDRPARVEED